MSAIYDYVGLVEKILDTQTVGNGFTKRSLIMTDDVDTYPQFPAHIEFTAKGQRVNLLDSLRAGQRVKLRFAIDSRVWHNPNTNQDVYFKDLTILNAEPVGATVEGAPAPASSVPSAPSSIPPVPPPADPVAADPEDLPF